MTNKEFAEGNEDFQAACANIPWKDKDGRPSSLPPTSRQASKWRNHKGLAYKEGREKKDDSRLGEGG